MVNDWYIPIESRPYMSSLSFKGNEYFNIIENFDGNEQPYYIIKSKCFDNINEEDPNHSLSMINGLKIIANGALALKNQCADRKAIELDLGFIMCNNNPLTTYKYLGRPCMNPFENIVYRHISNHTISIDKFSDLIRTASKYDAIREILFQIGIYLETNNVETNISTWTTLYSITDTITYYMNKEFSLTKDKAIKQLGGVKEDANRFGHTVNNFDYLGFYSRHGRKSDPAPLKPMNLNEAINYVLNLSNNFISYYVYNINKVTM